MTGTSEDPFGGFVGFEPLPGGHSGETFLAETGGERTVVRIFAAPHHHADAPEIQASLLHLVRDLVPVPPVLEVRRSAGEDGPGLLVTGLLPGVRGDLLLPELDDDGRRRAGAAVGAVAAALAAMPTLRAGRWADAELRIDPHDPSVAGWVDDHAAAMAGLGWTGSELAALARHAAAADDVLAGVRRTCVVHADLDPSNLLLDPATLAVTGVVDWERSRSGHPWTDLGSLLRLEGHPGYVDAVLGAWAERHPTPRGELAAGARAADLVALVGSATRAGQHPGADAAAAHLRARLASAEL